MYIIDKYIARSVLRIFIVISVILNGIVWLSQSMRILSLIVSKGISFLDFISISVLMLPSLIHFLLPIIYLFAIMYFVHKIRQDREFVIMQSIGMANERIIKPIISLGFVITTVAYINAAYLMPVSHAKFKDAKDYFQEAYSSLLLQEKSFSIQDKLTVYLESKKPDGTLHNIFISDNRHSDKQVVVHAMSGKIKSSASGPVFELNSGTHQEKNKQTNKISLVFFDQYVFYLNKLNDGKAGRGRNPDELTLWGIITNLPSKETDKRVYLSVFHQRMTWPFLLLSLSILATVLLLGNGYKRKYHSMEYVRCLLICCIFILLSILLTSMIKNNVWWSIALYAVTVAPILIARYKLEIESKAFKKIGLIVDG